ncbi:class I SAM-dependent methyltransferase [Citricoccus sp.]|uniref:O-methyltransferase n=1 Tax=Citricoccus sp. TaxID=1978372 RepID=UPI0028BD2B1E|nr:class I SAM-dependent methyltransferase [Citricoccus sp.]
MKALSPHQTDKHASWAFAESRPAEDDVLLRARERSSDLGIVPVTEGTAALLTVLAATRSPATLVEIGTGAGVSGIALMRGLTRDAMLTTIDPDAEALRAAREGFAEGGFPANRTRMITGRARTVVPRLNSKAYDLVLLDADKASLVFHVEQAARLLRPGGLLIVNDALDEDRVPKPAVREASTVAAREAGKLLRDEETWHSALVPTGSGVLLAVRR